MANTSRTPNAYGSQQFRRTMEQLRDAHRDAPVLFARDNLSHGLAWVRHDAEDAREFGITHEALGSPSQWKLLRLFIGEIASAVFFGYQPAHKTVYSEMVRHYSALAGANGEQSQDITLVVHDGTPMHLNFGESPTNDQARPNQRGYTLSDIMFAGGLMLRDVASIVINPVRDAWTSQGLTDQQFRPGLRNDIGDSGRSTPLGPAQRL